MQDHPVSYLHSRIYAYAWIDNAVFPYCGARANEYVAHYAAAVAHLNVAADTAVRAYENLLAD